jgi:hypothetical protein
MFDHSSLLLQLSDLESALRKREDLIVQLSSALQTVTSQAPSDVIAVELTQEVQNLKAQLLNVRHKKVVGPTPKCTAQNN